LPNADARTEPLPSSKEVARNGRTISERSQGTTVRDRRLTFDFDLECVLPLFVIRTAAWLTAPSSALI